MQCVTRNLPATWLLASFHLYYASLDDCVDVPVVDCTIAGDSDGFRLDSNHFNENVVVNPYGLLLL